MTSIIADYRFIEPSTPAEFAARDQLLAISLRSENPKTYPIDEEYPLVLAKDFAARSVCLTGIKNQSADTVVPDIAAHANLWIRTFAPATGSGPTYRLAFVGNVATQPQLRRQGLLRKLMTELEERARRQNADLIVLWSDLVDVYERLGFRQAGRELRATLPQRQLQEFDSAASIDIKAPAGYQTGKLAAKTLKRMLELRRRNFVEPFYQIERTDQEFSALLQIPDTALFIGKNIERPTTTDADDFDFYMIIGKGADLQGVIHEWGTTDMRLLLAGVHRVIKYAELDDIMMLLPPGLQDECMAQIKVRTSEIVEHPLAWIKHIASAEKQTLVEQALNQGFIWGLDSI